MAPRFLNWVFGWKIISIISTGKNKKKNKKWRSKLYGRGRQSFPYGIKGVIQIKNKDNLCLARAIGAGMLGKQKTVDSSKQKRFG